MAAVSKPPSTKKWYDKPSIRHCEDGTLHEGRLELITWSYTPDKDEDLWDEPTGFASVILKEEKEFKDHFEVRVELHEYGILGFLGMRE
jgi:hypothetical protein